MVNAPETSRCATFSRVRGSCGGWASGRIVASPTIRIVRRCPLARTLCRVPPRGRARPAPPVAQPAAPAGALGARRRRRRPARQPVAPARARAGARLGPGAGRRPDPAGGLPGPPAGPRRAGEPWAWLTPCHWQVGTDHIRMAPLHDLQLGEDDSRAMLAAVHPYFAEDGIELEYEEPLRWLARGEIFRALPTASLDGWSGAPSPLPGCRPGQPAGRCAGCNRKCRCCCTRCPSTTTASAAVTLIVRARISRLRRDLRCSRVTAVAEVAGAAERALRGSASPQSVAALMASAPSTLHCEPVLRSPRPVARVTCERFAEHLLAL